MAIINDLNNFIYAKNISSIEKIIALRINLSVTIFGRLCKGLKAFFRIN